MRETVLDTIAQHTRIPVRHIVGPITGVAIGLAFVLPRTAWITLAILVVLIMLALSDPLRRLRDLMRPEPVTIVFALLCAWAATSTLWATEPTDGALKAVWLFLIVLFAYAGTGNASALDDDALNAFGIGLVIALILMAGLLAFETWSGKALMRLLADTFPTLQRPGKHMVVRDGEVLSISDNEINRRACVFTLLLLPGLAASRYLVGGLLGQVASIILLVEAAVIAVGTEHQSSQLALLAGALALLLYLSSPRVAFVAVVAGWLVATLFVVPIAAIPYDIGLSRDERLPFSFRERFSMWKWYSTHVGLNPVLGAGANTTPVVDLEIREAQTSAGLTQDRLGARYPGRHAHNYYLQVWYELGAVGSVLFMVAGLAGLRLVGQMEAQLRWLALAQFAVTAGMIATSYGLWQIWTQGTIAISAVVLALPRPTKHGRTRG